MAACLIVRNEQERLPAALESVSFCDEVIVVDSGSRDRTREIARSAGAMVIEHPWSGFGAQRNVAIDAATADWILEVDADERISPALQAELVQFLAAPAHDIAIGTLPMREWFLGRLLGPAIKYPHYRTRLFRRGAYRHDELRRVHEGIWPCGRTWAAQADMHHILAGSLREAMTDWWRYSRLEAEQSPPLRGPRAHVNALVVRPAIKLAYRTVVDEAWRDGGAGMLKAVLDSAHDIMVRLWQLRAGRPTDHRQAREGAHFGRVEQYCGPVRVVALVDGAEATQRAIRWLAGARDAGADVALVTIDREVGAREGWLEVHAIDRLGPLRVLRALDAAAQVRPYDALAVTPGRAWRLASRLPHRFRGLVALQSMDATPAATVAAVVEHTRPQGPEPAPGVPVGASARYTRPT